MILKRYTGTSEKRADLSLSEFEGEGELTEIAPYAFKEHRELTEVEIPEAVTEIGHDAFYNCRNLRKIIFYDSLKSLGDGVLRNCTKLYFIGVKRAGGSLIALKDILSEYSERLTVSLYESEIFFPHYQLEFKEDNGARIVNQITHGAGASYRECLNREALDYHKYDALFSTCKYTMDIEEGIEIAKARLSYPLELKEEIRAEYSEFLRNNKKIILRSIADLKEATELEKIIKIGVFFKKNETDEAIDYFCENDFAEGVSILIDYRNKTFETNSIFDMEI